MKLGSALLDDIYKVKQFDVKKNDIEIGKITEKERFRAAKQILLGLAILYLCTLFAYLVRPNEGDKLMQIMTITFPPLATLILSAYFRDRHN
jgi:hypothetical protein